MLKVQQEERVYICNEYEKVVKFLIKTSEYQKYFK